MPKALVSGLALPGRSCQRQPEHDLPGNEKPLTTDQAFWRNQIWKPHPPISTPSQWWHLCSMLTAIYKSDCTFYHYNFVFLHWTPPSNPIIFSAFYFLAAMDIPQCPSFLRQTQVISRCNIRQLKTSWNDRHKYKLFSSAIQNPEYTCTCLYIGLPALVGSQI